MKLPNQLGEEQPQLELEELYGKLEPSPMLGALWDESLRASPCRECGGTFASAEMVVCDGCEDTFHPDPCANFRGLSPVHAGPWYCFRCRGRLMS